MEKNYKKKEVHGFQVRKKEDNMHIFNGEDLPEYGAMVVKGKTVKCGYLYTFIVECIDREKKELHLKFFNEDIRCKLKYHSSYFPNVLKEGDLLDIPVYDGYSMGEDVYIIMSSVEL